MTIFELCARHGGDELGLEETDRLRRRRGR